MPSHHFCGYAMTTIFKSSLQSLKYQQGFIGMPPSASGSSDAEQLLALTLDEIACGVIVVDELGHIQHCNLAGKAILERAKLLKQENMQLLTIDAEDQNELMDALFSATKGKRGMLAVGENSQCTVAVVPLDRHADAHKSAADQNAPCRIALIFSRSGMCETLMMSFFARAYQLTRSEEQILSLLSAGHTAPEMAKQLQVGEATVRTHIRNICQKTNSHGIREVLKRLALLPPLMAAVMPPAFA
jgi:DNA-binding CsgD family transcriptional regulator